MQFSKLATIFESIEAISSRVEITKILADLFKQLSPEEIEKTAYLLQGRVCPLYEKIDFGMAEKMVIRSIASALQLDKSAVQTQMSKLGDVGETVVHFKKEIKSFEEREMSILEVYHELLRLAKSSGPGSQETKSGILASLVRQLDPLSTRFIVRIPLGALRLGFSDMTIIDAYSWMATGDKSLRPSLQGSYHVRPDLGYIGRVMKEKGIKGLEHVQPEVFTPILMMRAERLSSGEEIIKQIGKCSVEPKFDGFRLQIHMSRKSIKSLKSNDSDQVEVKLYTRGLEDATPMYPDIVEGVKKEIKADEAILEGEAIGFEPNSQTFLPFQETVQRKRKYDVEEKAKEIPLKLFAFELLYCDGVSYVNTPFVERRKKLEKIVKTTGDLATDTIIVAKDELIDDPKRLELVFDDAITKGLEGIVAKKLDGTYQPGARGWNWIKFKRSYSSKINDTIDCVVMGYDYGKGKRVGFGIGAFLAGVYDEKEDQFLTVAKIGTGLSDDEWKSLHLKSQKSKVKEKPTNYQVDPMMNCDVWVTPSIVVEIKADELTRSSVHTAGRVMKNTKSGNATEVDIPGFALRFPRLERFREDKQAQDATTVKEVEKMFDKQGK